MLGRFNRAISERIFVSEHRRVCMPGMDTQVERADREVEPGQRMTLERLGLCKSTIQEIRTMNQAHEAIQDRCRALGTIFYRKGWLKSADKAPTPAILCKIANERTIKLKDF